MRRFTLRKALERAKCSPNELVARSEGAVSRATVYRLLGRGDVNPSYDTVDAIERALELPRGTLVFGAQAAELDEVCS